MCSISADELQGAGDGHLHLKVKHFKVQGPFDILEPSMKTLQVRPLTCRLVWENERSWCSIIDKLGSF